MTTTAPALRRGRPRLDRAPRTFSREECARLAGVGVATVSHGLNLFEDSAGARGLAYVVRRGPRVRVTAGALLRWIDDGCPGGRWRGDDVARGRG